MYLNLVALVLQISRSWSCCMVTWYVVYQGRHPGVYSNWPELCLALAGGDNNLYQAFKTREGADATFLAFRLSIVWWTKLIRMGNDVKTEAQFRCCNKEHFCVCYVYFAASLQNSVQKLWIVVFWSWAWPSFICAKHNLHKVVEVVAMLAWLPTATQTPATLGQASFIQWHKQQHLLQTSLAWLGLGLMG